MKKVLDGLKVLDFTWIVAGPMLTTHLAAHGATVVKVETLNRPDSLRVANPYKGDTAGINRSTYFSEYNPNKYGMTCNLAHPRGLDTIKKLVRWADVVVDNYAPGALKKSGLDYASVKKLNPSVIQLSLSFPGQDGPETGLKGFGFSLAAFSGFISLTGWPDKDPVPPYGAYTDFIAPRMACAALLAALIHRKKTGQGMYLDMSQLELSLQFLAPFILDFNANGSLHERDGNRSPGAAPHGVYPCRGKDRWCAIAAHNDEEWAALRQVMGEPAWTNDERFATRVGRKANEDQLDCLISAWTVGWDDRELMAALQKSGVTAGAVLTPGDVMRDEQLVSRGHYQMLTHPEIGRHSYSSIAFKMSKADDRYERPAPGLGEHTAYVCTKLLGMSDEEFIELMNSGALQ